MSARSASRFVAVLGLLCALLVGACIKSDTTPCGDFVCSRGKRCDPIHKICVDQEQITLCEGQPDGTSCTFRDQPGYKCDQGVCIRVGECGDGVVDLREQCDLGGANSDSANAQCRTNCTTRHCGDGIADDDSGESCDGSDFGGKTCMDFGYAAPAGLTCLASCILDDSGCTASCGNGLAERGEECDEGAQNSDTTPGGCRTDCKRFSCGDGVQDPGEACDDGDNVDDKGCSADCRSLCGDGVLNGNLGEECDRAQDNGVSPSDCLTDCTLTTCGDGYVGGDEECDDGGTTAGDGCSATCRVEANYSCSFDATLGRSVCGCAGFSYGSDCSQCVVFVDQGSTASDPDGRSWDTAFTDVQRGIDAAHDTGPGCQVWVMQGTYRVFRATLLDTIQLRSDVAIYGGFQDDTATTLSDRNPAQYRTILDGEQAPGGVRVLHVVTAQGTAGALLDGLVIRGGNAQGLGNDARGGGLFAYGASLTLVDVDVESNTSADSGAGIYAYASAITMRGGAVSDNRAFGGEGGGLYLDLGNLSLTDTHVEDNAAPDGGGAYVADAGAMDVWGGVFSGNAALGGVMGGGGLCVGGPADVVVTGTVFAGNTAGAGGGAFTNDRGRFRRCTFVGNTAVTTGGGLRGGASTLVVDSGFHANRAEIDGGGLAGLGTVIRRSVIAANVSLYGGGAVLEEGAVVESTAMVGNRAFAGGGVHVGVRGETGEILIGGEVTLLGCTLTGNRAASGGGVYIATPEISEVTGSVVWGNFAQAYPAIHPSRSVGGGAVIRYSLTDAPWSPPQPTVVVADPGFVSPPVGGTLASAVYDPSTFQTTLTIGTASWSPGALAGRFISFGQTPPQAPWYFIVSNTASSLTVWGNVTGRAGLGVTYYFLDPRLGSSSPAIDAGSSPPLGPSDVDGRARAVDSPPADTGYGSPPADIGAYEFQVGGTAEVCGNTTDDDGDGLADCADPDCAAEAACQPLVERSCEDLADDDGDGLIDCADPDCAGVGPCRGERNCADNYDDDGDGLVDCADTEDCDGRAGCPNLWESDCRATSGDEDGNGYANCADPRCQGRDACTPGQESNCDDGIDNDGDGQVDCADWDCKQEFSICPEPEMDCSDGIDNDNNGATDCEDIKCLLISNDCTTVLMEVDCSDGIDNDGDGATDCADYDCVHGPDCESGIVESSCSDGTDNDGDGVADCDDADCWSDPVCLPPDREHDCGDGLDDDNQNGIDCQDPTCATLAKCRRVENSNCHDGIDNDGDGLIDCADPDCAQDPLGRSCHPQEICPTAVASGGGVDEDANGLADCLDPACAGKFPCEAPKEQTCDDNIDNDGDGLVDCADPDCEGVDNQYCFTTPEDCTTASDDDGDGLGGCADPECVLAPGCL